MNYLQSAQALYEQMVRDRRHLHQHPEVGMDLPETCSYVMARLTEMAISPGGWEGRHRHRDRKARREGVPAPGRYGRSAHA